MAIVRFDPFRELDRLQSDVNRLFEGYTHAPEAAPATNGGRMWSPAVDIVETDNEIVVRAEVPGVRQEDIDIELTGDTLTVRGERKFEEAPAGGSYARVERAFGRFQRTFTLGVPVEQDKVRALYRDGILEITLPKSEETRPRKVQVNAG